MFNRLFGFGQAPTYEKEPEPSEPPLAEAPGALYSTTTAPDGARDQTLEYMECSATLMLTASENDFDLRITRTGNPEPGDLSPAHLSFPVRRDARFEYVEPTFGWSAKDGKRFNLDVDTEDAAEDFNAALAVALFRHEHQRAPGPADADEVRMMTQPQEPERPSELLIAAGELLKVEGELFRYDIDKSSFQTVAPRVHVSINSAVVKDDGSRAFMMVVKTPDGVNIMECEINNDMNSQFFSQTMSLVWVLTLDPNAADEEEDPDQQLCLSVKVVDSDSFTRLRNQYSMCLYEVNHKATMDDRKLKEDDRQYVARSDWDDVEPMDVDDEADPEDIEDSRSLRDEQPGLRATMDNISNGAENSQLAVSATTDRTFVVRGDRMGVFQTGPDGAKFTTSIPFRDPSKRGDSFVPSNILLHEQDRSMLVLDPNDDTKVMRMDLERGEIVDTWAGPVTKNTPMSTVHRVEKYANLTDTKEFVGLNKSALLRMDPRTKEFIVQSKKYAASTRARLDCVATTGNGHLAVASETGDIRLYDTIGKNAKTHLPGLGDRILGIDVTADGQFVLATTAKYLLIINTVVQGEKSHSGFQKSMGKHKPAPRKLTIRPEDVVRYRMGEINFTPAHFNTGTSLERSIVTSSGPFLITWSFRSVKLGHNDSYKIVRYQDNVVADDFTFNNDGKIVVTLPNDVSVANRR